MSSRYSQLRNEVRTRRRSGSQQPVTVAVDVAGGESGAFELLSGAFQAVTNQPLTSVICVGNVHEMQKTMVQHNLVHPRLTLQHAPDVVTMKDQPGQAIKKKESSIFVAAELVKAGTAQALVAPGNTGATMAICMIRWGRLPGISRPAIAAVLPHPRRPCLLLDVGANVDCKPKNLLHFAVMGSVYARYVLHRRSPRVGLLSNGEEECKGNLLNREVLGILQSSTLNFRGNAEGRDLMKGTLDVVVCDGFTGNIVLKFGEGLAEFIMTNLKDEVQKSVVSKLGALAMLPALRNFKKQVDHAEYGGAPLLGLNGTCVICHGSSRAKAIMNAIRVASEQVSLKINEHIVEVLEANPVIAAPIIQDA